MWQLTRRALAILLLLTSTLFLWVLFTPAGSLWALEQADKRLKGLSISAISGRLYDDLTVGELLYQTVDTEIEVEDIHAQWRLTCLLKMTICLDNIQLSRLSLQLPMKDETAEIDHKTFSFPELPLSIEIKQAIISSLTYTQNSQTHSIENISLSASVDDSAIRLDNASFMWRDNKAQLSGEIALLSHYPIKISARAVLPTLVGANGSEIHFEANGHINKELLIKAHLSGHQTADFNAVIKPTAHPLQLSGSLKAQLLRSLEVSENALVLKDLALEFSGDLEKLDLKTQALLIADKLPDNQFEASAQLQDLAKLSDIELLIDTLGGRIELMGGLSWQQHLSWDITGDIKNIDIKQYREDIQATVSGQLKSQGEQQDGEFISPTTTLSVSGILQEQPLSANIDLSLGKQAKVTLHALELLSGANRLTAQGTLDQQLDLNAELSAPNLAELWPGLDGSLAGSLEASGEREKPTVQAVLGGNALALGDISIAELALQAHLAQGGTGESSLDVESTGVKIANLDNASLQAQINGSLSQHALALNAGTSAQTVALQLSGSLDQSDWNGELSSAHLAHNKMQLELQAPTAIAWDNDLAQFAVDAHCWLRAQASLCLKQNTTLSAAKGAASVVVSNLNLADLNPWLPKKTKLSGIFQAELDGSWDQNEAPIVRLKSEAKKLALQSTDLDGNAFKTIFNQAQLAANLDQHRGDLSLQLSSAELGHTEIDAHIVPNTKALTGNINIDGFLLQPLQSLIPMLDKLEGEVSANGVLSGQLDDPQFKGKVELKNPAIAGATIPLTISAGNVVVDVDGRDAKLKAGFKVQPTGNLRIAGDISYREDLHADIELIGDKLALILPPAIDATVNHNMSLSIRPAKVSVRGKVHVPDATIVPEGIKGGGPSLSKDLVFTDAEDQSNISEIKGSALQTDIDIQVQVDEQVRMSGYGFDTRLLGDIKIRQRPNQPVQLAGELSLKEGSYRAYGQDLNVRRGELLFVGPVRTTRLDVDAFRTVDNVEAGLILEGTLLSPVTTLYSDPAMSDADVLSYIILGGPPGQGGGESAILARAALNLGLKNGNRVAGQFASAAGIEDFNIGADGKGEDTAVLLSGRVSPKLLLSYRIGIFDAVDTLTARYDFNQEIYLELMRGIDQAIDLFYRFDY